MAAPQLLMPVPATPIPSPYLAMISCAVALAAASSRSTHTTCAPSFTRRWAVAFPMPAPAPDDHDDPPIELLLRRQPPELRLFEEPVLDVEGLLLVHRLVSVDRLGTAHDLDGAVVELGGDPRLALVLPPGDHPQPGDQHHGRVGIAHRRRIGTLAALVVGLVVLRYCIEALR